MKPATQFFALLARNKPSGSGTVINLALVWASSLRCASLKWPAIVWLRPCWQLGETLGVPGARGCLEGISANLLQWCLSRITDPGGTEFRNWSHHSEIRPFAVQVIGQDDDLLPNGTLPTDDQLVSTFCVRNWLCGTNSGVVTSPCYHHKQSSRTGCLFLAASCWESILIHQPASHFLQFVCFFCPFLTMSTSGTTQAVLCMLLGSKCLGHNWFCDLIHQSLPVSWQPGWMASLMDDLREHGGLLLQNGECNGI